MRNDAAGRMEMVTINPGAVLAPMYGNSPPGRVMHIAVERLGGVGPWVRGH
jgi:hypothetical protein